MLVGYARVSKGDQSLNRQLDALIAYGVDRRNIYQEKIAGTIKTRPELERMIAELQNGDRVIVADLTRLGRSTKDLFAIADQIQEKGADIISLKESWLDTTTPHGKLLFTMFAGLSQFERDLTSERTKEGLRAAKARGRSGGRPSKQNEHAKAVLAMYNAGMKKVDIKRRLPVSLSTIDRIVKGRKESN